MIPYLRLHFAIRILCNPYGVKKKIWHRAPQGDALAYPGLNYLALSGLNTLILKTLYEIENITCKFLI